MSDLFDRMARAAEAAVQRRMDALRDDVKKRISVPVQRVGGKTIRSKPGEPPRRDTGRLQASASAQTIDATRSVIGSVSVSTPYARKLLAINRPIFGPLLQEHRAEIVADIRRALTNP